MIELNYVAYHNGEKCRVLSISLNNNKILIEYIDSKIRKEVRLDDVEKLQYVEPEVNYPTAKAVGLKPHVDQTKA